ncbi:hypothetical protein V501_02648 [Pseudogymnoascus sp. VKM F-4519 (FW-2642)]|nr:hypothetical protein V501_02648 [Pseudogymnoascus sp. VKM F-4519 (FW-2642)]
MARPSQLVPKAPAADSEAPDAPNGPVLRLVCGWDEKTNDYLYRDDVKNPPPLFGDGPERAPTQLRTASVRDAKPTNISARGKERMKSRRRARVARRASPLQQSTPNEIHVDEPLYAVPKDLQGTTRPMPKPVNTQDIQWEEMQITAVPLLNDRTVQIHGYDDIMVTLVSSVNKRAHNEPAKVLDCRLHPNGTYFLLVSWYSDRRGLLKSVVGYENNIRSMWPADSPFEFVLGCQFDVITRDTIVSRIVNDGRFCTSMVYGGPTYNHELFSDVPDGKRMKKGITGDVRPAEERNRKSLFHALLNKPWGVLSNGNCAVKQ